MIHGIRPWLDLPPLPPKSDQQLADEFWQETELQRLVRRRREELWEEQFGPESEAAKKYEEAIWGTKNQSEKEQR